MRFILVFVSNIKHIKHKKSSHIQKSYIFVNKMYKGNEFEANQKVCTVVDKKDVLNIQT